MRVKLVTDVSLPGAFRIEAETPEEALLIRIFCADERQIYIGSYGGDYERDQISMLIMHKPKTEEEDR
jgi:hypothetical protein